MAAVVCALHVVSVLFCERSQLLVMGVGWVKGEGVDHLGQIIEFEVDVHDRDDVAVRVADRLGAGYDQAAGEERRTGQSSRLTGGDGRCEPFFLEVKIEQGAIYLSPRWV